MTVRRSFRRAVSAHREALGLLDAAREVVDAAEGSAIYGPGALEAQAALVERLQQTAEALGGGWWTAPWQALLSERRPLGEDGAQGLTSLIRVGTGHPVSEGFPVIVPFMNGGHLCVDADARDPRVAGFIRGVLLRVLAAMPPGSVRVLAVDGGMLGATFTSLRPLVTAELMKPTAIDLDGMRSVLAEAEEHVRRTSPQDGPGLLLAIATLPKGCGRPEFARLAALAASGGRAGVHLVVCGYPPPVIEGGQPPLRLEHTTMLSRAGSEHFLVGDAPGEPFGADGRGLNAPVVIDTGPGEHLIDHVCRQVAEEAVAQAAARARIDFADLMPDHFWQESSLTGLHTPVGRAGATEEWLALDDATPHWLIGGRSGSGKSVFLLDVLYGLAARYPPDELALYLLDFKQGMSFTDFAPTERDPTWIPHARIVGIQSDREYGVAALEALSAEIAHRTTKLAQAGVNTFAHLRTSWRSLRLPRIVAVIEEFQDLLAGDDEPAERARTLLLEVARTGHTAGVHLILAGRTTSGIEVLAEGGEPVLRLFAQRVALPGGGGVLARLNDAAEGLRLGTAVLNHASGSVRANRRVRFPDADPDQLGRVRRTCWQRRAVTSAPPSVFAGYAEQHLADDPTLEELDPQVSRRRALLGRCVDVGLPSAAFTLDDSPGRNLGVVGTTAGADVLHAAALSLARQHEPGRAEFVLAGLVPSADAAAATAADELRRTGHLCSDVGVDGLRAALGRLARPPVEVEDAEDAEDAEGVDESIEEPEEAEDTEESEESEESEDTDHADDIAAVDEDETEEEADDETDDETDEETDDETDVDEAEDEDEPEAEDDTETEPEAEQEEQDAEEAEPEEEAEEEAEDEAEPVAAEGDPAEPEDDEPEDDEPEDDEPEDDEPEDDEPEEPEPDEPEPEAEQRPEATYLVIWGADAAGPVIAAARDEASGKSGLDDLRTVLRDGPGRGVHVLGWWRDAGRMRTDLGTEGMADVSGLVALDVTGDQVRELIGAGAPEWSPRRNRALLIDRHENRTALIVPFVRPAEGDSRDR
jgi:DNA segregation ATPase FtsK/SpoIIIE, S-DNA-T family